MSDQEPGSPSWDDFPDPEAELDSIEARGGRPWLLVGGGGMLAIAAAFTRCALFDADAGAITALLLAMVTALCMVVYGAVREFAFGGPRFEFWILGGGWAWVVGFGWFGASLERCVG